MNVTIADEHPPLTGDDIDRLERQLAIRLPDAYRSFLLAHNGGRPTPDLFLCKDGKGSFVQAFLGVYNAPHDNFVEYFQVFKVRRKAMPDNIVPVAHDPFGNQVCISVSGKDAGSVYFWDHEREPVRPSCRNLHLIAASFADFLSSLYEKQVIKHEAELKRVLLRDDVSAMEEAISAGWDVNFPTGINTFSALDFASLNNQQELVALLLRYGAEMGKALEKVKRAASLPPDRDYTKVIQLLSAHQATCLRTTQD